MFFTKMLLNGDKIPRILLTIGAFLFVSYTILSIKPNGFEIPVRNLLGQNTRKSVKSNSTKTKNVIRKAHNSDTFHPHWAYYDPRFGRITVLMLSAYLVNNTAFCHLFDSNRNILRNGSALRTVVFPDYTVHCPVSKYTPFVLVTAQPWIKSNDFPPIIPVQRIPKGPAKQKLAVCLSPIFGEYHYWMLLLQFVEFHRLVGANHFIVYYLHSDDRALLSLLTYYTDIGLATVVKLPANRNHSRCIGIHRCRHNFQIQDCIYRTMNRFQYVAVIDIDELLVPLSHPKIPDLLNSVSQPHYGAFKFRTRWTVRDEPEPTGELLFDRHPNRLRIHSQLGRHLPIVRFKNTTQAAPPRHTSKCIVRPETVAFMGVHFVRTFVADRQSFDVDKRLGYSRHYRNLTSWAPGYYFEVQNFGTVQPIELPWKLESRTLTAAEETLQRLLLRMNETVGLQ